MARSRWQLGDGLGRAVRQRIGTALALLALLSQLAVSLMPMPALAGDGTPICVLDDNSGDTSGPAAPKPDGHHGSHLPVCPVCQAVQLLGSLTPPDPVGVPILFRRVERAHLPVIAGVLRHRVPLRRHARAPPVEI